MTEAKKKPKKLISDYRKLRRNMGLSQTEFWGRLGVTQSAGSRYESSRDVPKPIAVLAHMAYIDKADIDAMEFK